jgi:hypothetical protein
MLKFRSDSYLSKQKKIKINIGLGHEHAWRIWSSLNEHMRWWYTHKIQNQCICMGFFLKPSILIMKDWQVLHMHKFLLSLLIVFYTFFSWTFVLIWLF